MLIKKFLKRFFVETGRAKFLDKLPTYLVDHHRFLDQYSDEISLRITDDLFEDRLAVAAEAVRRFIKMMEGSAENV